MTREEVLAATTGFAVRSRCGWPVRRGERWVLASSLIRPIRSSSSRELAVQWEASRARAAFGPDCSTGFIRFGDQDSLRT